MRVSTDIYDAEAKVLGYPREHSILKKDIDVVQTRSTSQFRKNYPGSPGDLSQDFSHETASIPCCGSRTLQLGRSRCSPSLLLEVPSSDVRGCRLSISYIIQSLSGSRCLAIRLGADQTFPGVV